MMTTNFKTLDQGRRARRVYARLIEVGDDYVVATYKDSGKPEHGPILYVSNMLTVEHFSDPSEAAAYFLTLMDPEEFGDPREFLENAKSHDADRSFVQREVVAK